MNKKPRHIIRKTIVCLCVLGLLGAMSVGWLVSWIAAREFDANYTYERFDDEVGEFYEAENDCIIVLGAQVKASGEPSEALLRRMKVALDSWRKWPRYIICCGGQGADEPMAEGDFMREWFIKQGVPETGVVSENTSVNTKQNLANALRIMGERYLLKALIVTSDYHLPRALAIAADLGINAQGAGSASRPEMWWKNHLREGLSWIKYWMGL